MKKYTFNNSTETKTADILINGEIDAYWSYGLKELSEELKTADAENINIQINSPGGSVTEGAALAAFISGYKKPINTSGFGLVASIATKILLAGSSVSMAEGSYFMIHQPWAAVGGESEELRKTADLLDKMKAELIQVYISKIAQNKKLINGSYEETAAQLEKWIDSETWFTASEAFEAGFIDKVTTGVQFLNKSNYQNIYNSVQNFKNVPEKLTNQIKNFADMQTTEETKENFFDKVKAWFFNNPAEAEKLTEDLKAKKQAEKEAEILKAVQIAKENGFYLEAQTETAEQAAPEVIEETEETEEIEAVEKDQKPVKGFDLDSQLKEENEALKAALKQAEEKAAAPSAGAGNKNNNNTTKSIDSLICPTAEHKEFVNFWGSKFQ
jgi:ATP-dependent protease ClpP protease subunit